MSDLASVYVKDPDLVFSLGSNLDPFTLEGRIRINFIFFSRVGYGSSQSEPGPGALESR